MTNDFSFTGSLRSVWQLSGDFIDLFFDSLKAL